MQAVVVIAKEPAIKADPSHPAIVTDGMGRNVTKWTQDIKGRHEGPPSVCLAINEGAARVYLSKEEALALALAIAEAADTLTE